MTSAAPEIGRLREARPPSNRIQPLRAIRAYRRLRADKEDTFQVFEIMRALNGNSTRRAYQRLLNAPGGGRIAYERVELAERLSDRAFIDSFPECSVGAAYRAFVDSEHLSAQGLVEESRKGEDPSAADRKHPYAWFGRRIRDIHDIWHVLTGYGRDGLGELCLVAFTYPQTKALGWAFIGLAGTREYARLKDGHPYVKAVREAWRHGREAAWLPGEDYERLLFEPLGKARARLGIQSPSVYLSIPPEARNRGDRRAA